MLSHPQIIEGHSLVNVQRPSTYVDAANYFVEIANGQPISGIEKAKELLSVLFYSFLNADQYIEAALLGWGITKFNPEPREVQDLFSSLGSYSKNLILGSAALGKSYGAILWHLEDWVRDPEYTNSKIISTTERHAASNAWSTLLDFHRSCIISLPGKPGAEIITIRPNDRQAAIGLVAIPVGNDGKGRLQGFHPLPRPTPHPKYGKLSRVSALLDEAEKIPIGVWDGIDNLLTSENTQGSVRVTGLTNPADITSIFAQRSEFPKGWQEFDMDANFEWMSEQDYHVLRLDAKYSENVIQKKEIYPGFQTYQGFMNLLRQGEKSAAFYTFGRGAYPQESVEYNIVSPAYLKDSKKIYNFISMPQNVASLDPAFAEGGDEAIITTGRYGIANGFLEGSNLIPFSPKPALQIEQQIHLDKGLTPDMADNFISILKELHVRPEWVVVDQTGNGLGLHDTLKVKFGDILGVMWGAGATDKKILQEDTVAANERYKDIVTEMLFSFSQWLCFGHIKFMPMMETRQLFTEATMRQYSRVGGLDRAESKRAYKSRTKQPSCDRLDSAIMLCHLCRMRGAEGRPAMLNLPKPRTPKPDLWLNTQPLPTRDAIDYINFD